MAYEDDRRGYKQYDGLWGEQLSKMKNRLVYRRGGKSICVYCGEKAYTREHCPPKFLLFDPYPPNLSELPACYECNNGFSALEEKVKGLIFDIEDIELGKEGISGKSLRGDVAKIYSERIFPDYFKKIFTKIARGHAVYKLGDGFGDSSYIPLSIEVVLKSFVSESDWLDRSLPTVIETLPELGARSLEDIFALECINDEDVMSSKSMYVDWTISQENVYRYLTLFQKDRIMVQMIIRECIWVQVSLKVIACPTEKEELLEE